MEERNGGAQVLCCGLVNLHVSPYDRSLDWFMYFSRICCGAWPTRAFAQWSSQFIIPGFSHKARYYILANKSPQIIICFVLCLLLDLAGWNARLLTGPPKLLGILLKPVQLPVDMCALLLLWFVCVNMSSVSCSQANPAEKLWLLV